MEPSPKTGSQKPSGDHPEVFFNSQLCAVLRAVPVLEMAMGNLLQVALLGLDPVTSRGVPELSAGREAERRGNC